MLKYAAALLATSAVVFAAPVLSTSAHAALVTKTATYGAVATDWSGSTNSVNIDQFDPLLGKLTSVTVSVSETVNGSVTIGGTFPIIANSLDGRASILVIDPFQPLGGCSLTYSSCIFSGITGADVQVVNVSNVTYTDAKVFNIVNATGVSGDTYSAGAGDLAFVSTDTTYLNGFTGNGLVNFVMVTSTTLDANITGGSPTITQNTTDLATLTVEYTYDTPEPASLALFGGALAALGAIRRRKAAR